MTVMKPGVDTRRVKDAMVTAPKVHPVGTTLNEIWDLFQDEHVHMALVVSSDGELLTTIERSDLYSCVDSSPADQVGTLSGRTVAPDEPLSRATEALKRSGRRRFAVVGGSNVLIGLLCLKRDGNGYCSDSRILERARERIRELR